MLLYASTDTLEYVLVNAKAAIIMPRITLFHIAGPLRKNTKGEITSQIPRIRFSQLHPG
jgi:hypothetical protein